MDAGRVSHSAEPCIGRVSADGQRWLSWGWCSSGACGGSASEGFLGRQARAGPSIHSVAVLPLENLSGDQDQEYVADGMTEALIARLGGLRSLRVISRTSAMQFKGGRKSRPGDCRSLKVDAVVTGSVQRSGDRIRVTANLIRSDPETQLWSGTYDRDVRDVLALQSERCARHRAASRHHRHWPGERPSLGHDRQPSHRRSTTATSRGAFTSTGIHAASIEQSITHFEAAIAGDATFAPAYLGLATAHGSFGTITIGASPPSDVLPKAVAAATRALELDPTLADAHVWLADLHNRDMAVGRGRVRLPARARAEPEPRTRARAVWAGGFSTVDAARRRLRNHAAGATSTRSRWTWACQLRRHALHRAPVRRGDPRAAQHPALGPGQLECADDSRDGAGREGAIR